MPATRRSSSCSRCGPLADWLDSHDEADPAIERILRSAFPEVLAALDPNGLDPAEFADFGPVRHFRDMFVAGWDTLLATIRSERSQPVTAPVAAQRAAG
jgi:hypothetical protein